MTGKRAVFDASGNGAVGVQGGFAFDELGEVVEMGDCVFGGGGGQGLAVFFEEGQAQGVEVGVKGGGQGHDLVDVAAGVKTAGGELLVVMLGVRTQGVKGEQPFGVAGAASLVQEFLDVVGIFKVAVALVTAWMQGDEVVRVVKAEAVGKGHEGEALRGVECGHGVTVGIQGDAAAVGDPHQARHGGVGGHRWQRTQGGLFD